MATCRQAADCQDQRWATHRPNDGQLTIQTHAPWPRRYLASGADDSSVWLEAKRVEGHEVICEANNSAELSGGVANVANTIRVFEST
jgi:hypothetical protein